MLDDICLRAGARLGLTPIDQAEEGLPSQQVQDLAQVIYGQRVDVTVFRIKMWWYTVASCIQGFAILFAALLYWGWWQLGRRVSFSPIEIAKAFDAPSLQSVNTNAGAKGLIRDVGHLHIRYGAVKQEHALLEDSKNGSAPSITDEPRDRLVFGIADKAVRPYSGQAFTK